MWSILGYVHNAWQLMQPTCTLPMLFDVLMPSLPDTFSDTIVCLQGFNSVERNTSALTDLWCEDRDNWLDALGQNVTDATRQCTDMSLQVNDRASVIQVHFIMDFLNMISS